MRFQTSYKDNEFTANLITAHTSTFKMVFLL